MTNQDIGAPPRPTSTQIENEIRRRKLHSEAMRAIWGAVRTLLLFAAVAVLVSTFIFPVVQVQKGSMNPTLHDGEVLVFLAVGPTRNGDIVAFHYNNQILIKRILASGGDRLETDSDGRILRNGEALDEPYIAQAGIGEHTVSLPLQIPGRQLFLAGDNRATSIDSRDADFGLIQEDRIVGRAVLRVWPIQKLGFIR